MNIEIANLDDLSNILTLQKQAFASEAEFLRNDQIQPLIQTLKEVEDEFNKGVILKAVDESQHIIGSIRGNAIENTLYIGKLVVDPKCQHQGIGRQLLKALELLYPTLRYELFTRSKHEKNIPFYLKNGYVPFKYETQDNIHFTYFEKNV